MIKRIITFLAVALALVQATHAQTEKLDYYFGADVAFDASIPSPEEFLGYPIGSRITEHSRINAYFEKLAELSDRTRLLEIGRTHENRKIQVLVVSSPEHIRDLDQYKKAREAVRQGKKPDSPLIVFLGYAVHGNEISASEAALLSAYYFTAAQTDQVRRQLEEGIYFIDPVRNPDGQERFASWINSNTSVNGYNTSRYDREHTEGWPRGRGNHYWFDLNRDWVNLVHPESRARVALYQDWLPHVQADHHEMGTNSTFFFEPTDPDGNESRFVPSSTYELNRRFADYFARALDKIGSFYYTKESYDNRNPNFGSTYPDYNGGVGILFEQGSSRGLQQESDNGLVTLPFTIRNQLVTTIATVDAAHGNREALFDLQEEFFTPERPSRGSARAYIVGDSHDATRLHKFVRLLLDHRLEVYENPNDVVVNDVTYEKGKSYLIPAGQPNRALVGIIFDDINEYPEEVVDKLGYGAGFSVAYSTGLSYDETNASLGNRVATAPVAHPPHLQSSEYAYLIDYRDSGSLPLLFDLLNKGIRVRSAFKPFTVNGTGGERELGSGSLLIPVQNQPLSSEELYAVLQEAGAREKVEIIPVTTGYNARGVDLGSSSFRRLDPPKVLVVTGGDVTSTEAGEVWHLFDQQLRYPLTRVDADVFRRVPLQEYNRIVFVSGAYSFLNDSDIENLKGWVRNGGTLIAVNGGARWAVSNDLTPAKLKERNEALPGYRQPTSIFETRVDTEHPLSFGLTREKLPVVRESAFYLESSPDAVSSYSDEPLLNGYIAPEHLEDLKGASSILVTSSGRGSVVLFAENPLFRGTWDGTRRAFVNALLYSF